MFSRYSLRQARKAPVKNSSTAAAAVVPMIQFSVLCVSPATKDRNVNNAQLINAHQERQTAFRNGHNSRIDRPPAFAGEIRYDGFVRRSSFGFQPAKMK